MMIGSLAVTQGLMVGAPMRANTRMADPMMASVTDTLSSIEGPDLYWGEKGPLQNPMKEESDFKEYDSYSTFLDACKTHGVDLNAPGITVFAPGNNACAEYSSVYGPLSAAVCKYMVVNGEVNLDSLSSIPLSTTEGSTITYRRMFRKHFVDNAFCGAMASPPRSSFAGDIKADNGIIHMINEVIYPGWSESAGMEGSEATRA